MAVDIVIEAVTRLIQKGVVTADQVKNRADGNRLVTEYIVSRNYPDYGPKPNAHKVIELLGGVKVTPKKEVGKAKKVKSKSKNVKPVSKNNKIDNDIDAEIKKLEEEEKNKLGEGSVVRA